MFRYLLLPMHICQVAPESVRVVEYPATIRANLTSFQLGVTFMLSMYVLPEGLQGARYKVRQCASLNLQPNPNPIANTNLLQAKGFVTMPTLEASHIMV